MTFVTVIVFSACVISFVSSVTLYGPQPRIVSQDGHLILYAAEHKNISLQTQGRGGIHINGVDLSETVKFSKGVSETVKKYGMTFESSIERLSTIEESLDKIKTFQVGSNVTTDTPVNSASVVRGIRRLNRRVNNLNKRIRTLTLLLIIDECSSNPCKNGGTCQDLFNNFICHCPPEWEGDLCNRDVNECARFAGTDLGCQNGATCVNKPGSYECLCPRGWFGLHCTRRTTDCKSGSNTDLCGHGTCVTQYNDVGYKCICDQGWTTDGRTPACTTDVDECSMSKPPCSVNPLVQCINLPGSYHCGSCPAGYTGTGFYCTDIDECNTFNGGCSVNPMVQCVNTLGSRICGNCPPGYTGNGITCSYQGICSVNNGGCHSLASCRSNPRISSTYIECICPPGYSGSGFGVNGCVRRFQPLSGPCDPNPCVHGVCSLNGISNYSCSCYRRYTGKNCDSLVNLCSTNTCQNGGTCVSVFGFSFRCTCTSGFTGPRCEQQRQACGGQLKSESGALAFPSGSYQNYESAMSCAWNIETNSSKVLNITFKRFDVEDARGCRYDWLQIHDGKDTLAPSFGRYCGTALPNGGQIISTHNVVYLWFRSDESVHFRGFELTWTSINPNCGEGLKEVTSHGSIQSPGAPGNYPNNRDCYWPLTAPAGKRLIFHFFTLIIGNNSKCDHDYLEFITGTRPEDPVFHRFCNTSHPSPLYSPGSEALIHFHSDANGTYPGFQITYSVAESMPGCGGVYTQNRGEIRSPTFDGTYANDLLCEYKIQLNENSRIRITFLTFGLEYSDACRFDYVAIYAGNTVDDLLIGKYCGNTMPSPYVTESNRVLIVFKTDWASADVGFVINYDTVCGGVFTDKSGILTSPGYPNRYDHGLECIYEIMQPLGTLIQLNIMDFDLEYNSHPRCFYDYLEIRDGHDASSPLIGKYCKGIPSRFVSTYNYFWIKLNTDATNSGRGFKANYTTSKYGCGGVMKDLTGTFSTPQYPNLYPPFQTCKWIIAAKPGSVIQITWLNFRTEMSYECSSDYLAIFDNNTDTGENSLIGKFCGAKPPPTFLSASNVVTLVFSSDNSGSQSGFLATYTILEEKNVCGGNYLTNAGTLKSPQFPQNYPLNIECTWTIQVKPGHQIMLNVMDFNLEEFRSCKYDYLEIRNGGTDASPLLGKFCGSAIPKNIPSHANKLFLRFKSDMTKTYRGFRITWTATATGCGGELNSPSGSIISPNYPEPYTTNTECIWKIIINPGSIIQVVFSDMDLEEQNVCSLDYVQVLDGPALNSKSLGKFCSENPSVIRSTSNSLMVLFRSDVSLNGRGFQLQYSTVCNNTVTGFGGVIESPNFPNSYPALVNCNWQIKVPLGNKINISFSHFDLEKMLIHRSNSSNSNKCVFDYVEILYSKSEDYESDNFEKYGTYCANDVPPLIALQSNLAQIHFVSDSFLYGNGFRLEWQLNGCGDILTHPEGTITSPNYPQHYPSSIECNWRIQVDFGNDVEITFYTLQVEKSYVCSLDHVTIYNGEDETYPEITTLCHLNKPLLVKSTGNSMFIKFVADSSIEDVGFYANYTSKPTKCGGKFVANKAAITSPNYPQNYDLNVTCGYEIEVEDGHAVFLHFVDFDLYSLLNDICSSNNDSYVKVYDGPTKDHPLLTKLCSKDGLNRTFISTTNKLYIEFVSQTMHAAKGFQAKYQKSCGARIETDGTGTIRSNMHEVEMGEENCTWTIISKDLTKHISLLVSNFESADYCEDGNKLTIYNGESSTAPFLAGYCGTKTPPMLTSDGAAMHIVLNSNSNLFATYTVFDSVCGGTLTANEAYFASPGYPKKYPMETECEWTISVPDGNHVSISFIYFELLESEHCNTDYLEIRQNNGSGKVLGIHCGDDLPTNLTSLGSVWIFLKTSRLEGDVSGVTAKGFYAEYYINHQNVLTGNSGRIVSPITLQLAYKSDYSWQITVDYGKRILLTFKEFNSWNDINCYTQLNMYDGSDESAPSLGDFCGVDRPKSVKTSSNVVFITYDGYVILGIRNHFVLEWLAIDAVTSVNIDAKTKGCGTTEPINVNALGNYTVITSPGFPNGYGSLLNCEWIFTTVPMNKLRIYFTEMNLMRTYLCIGDYVEVFEKKENGDWSSVVKACQNNITQKVDIYTNNMMKVNFRTDNYGNRTGFSAMIAEDCGGTLTDPEGFILYDNNTKSYVERYQRECQWNITVKAGRTIEIEFLDFYIHNLEDKACRNYLMIRNGKFPDSPILGTGKYCDEHLPPTLKTTGNNAYIKYKGERLSSHFKLRYREVSYFCNGDIQLTHFDNSTVITSPNYPSLPPSHIECYWKILAPRGEVLRIDFIDRFDLTETKNCTDEYVEIRDGGTKFSKQLGRFCKAPSSQFSTDNMMLVKFFTEVTDPGNGFKARISIAKCGGTIRALIGQVHSPYFNDPNRYPQDVSCTWRLIGQSGHTLNLKFTKIDLKESSNCTLVDHVTISENDDVTRRVNTLGQYCGKTNPNNIKSSGSEVTVHFATSKKKQELGGFSLNFSSSLEACGDTIEASDGTIQSPSYPVSSKVVRRCSWFIKAPRGRRVSLKIEDYQYNTRLRDSWLQGLLVYNYKNHQSFITAVLPKDVGTTIKSSENYMFLYYWSSGAETRGFKARFSSNEPTACEGDFNRDSGIITQPKMSIPFRCTYIRDTSTVGVTVALTVTTATNATNPSGKPMCDMSGRITLRSADDETDLVTINCFPKTYTIRSPYPKMTLNAIQFSRRNHINYTISYNTYQCGGIMTLGNSESRTIESGNNVAAPLECSWIIELPEEQSILLTFQSLDLGTNCESSYLDIYNGNTPNSPKIDRYCQKNLPEPIHSQTNYLWIDYKFRPEFGSKGFSLKFEPHIQGCGGIFHDRNRIIETPSYPDQYPNNAECLWEIRSDTGYHIGLIFTNRFQIEQSDHCENDFVEVWDWRNESWFSLGKKCGREFPNAINSTSNRMKVLFRSNERISGTGFKARWEWNCGGTFVADSTKRYIVSPGFPVSYGKRLKCEYHIMTTTSNLINVRFEHFDLEGSGSRCKYDNVTLKTRFYRSPYNDESFCGQRAPPSSRFRYNIDILFQTDAWVQRTGFKFSYQLDSCGGNISAPTTITTPDNTISSEPWYRFACQWNIVAPPKMVTIIEFERFLFASRGECFFNHVQIFEGANTDRSHRIANLCGDLNKRLPTIRTTANMSTITLLTELNFPNSGFKAQIFFKDDCGGTIRFNESKSLDAPNLPDMDCSWTFITAVGKSIKIHFDELNLPSTCGTTNSSTNCSCASVEVRDGYAGMGEIVETICGISSTDFRREITSTSNTVGIRIITRGLVQKAFKITLTSMDSICGRVYLNVTNSVQTIQSPNYPHKYPSDFKCMWVLQSQSNILLHFVDFDLNQEEDQHILNNDCTEDRLEITDDTNELSAGVGPNFSLYGRKILQPQFHWYSQMSGKHQFCGQSMKPFDYYSLQSSLVLKFSSGGRAATRGRGFKLEYHNAGCNRNFTSLQGRIALNILEDCYQLISVPENYTISLFFQRFSLYMENNCSFVGIEIRDGGSEKANLLQRSCGQVLPKPVFSTGNKLWLHMWNTRRPLGYLSFFDLVYTSSDEGRGCGGTLYNYHGRFSSPFYPLPYKKTKPCVWNVYVPIGVRVGLQLEEFHIQGDCKDNYLVVTTYNKDVSNEHKFCRDDNPAVLYSDSHLMVKYQSSLNNDAVGWMAVFHTVHKD